MEKFKTQALGGTLFCSQFITSYHGCLLVLLHFHKIIVLAFHFFSRIFKALQADCRQVPANYGVHTVHFRKGRRIEYIQIHIQKQKPDSIIKHISLCYRAISTSLIKLKSISRLQKLSIFSHFVLFFFSKVCYNKFFL